MVNINEARALNTALVQKMPFVAVFFSTGGIASYTLRALATTAASGGKELRAYIVGRKAEPAEKMIAECRGILPKGEFKFVKAEDLSLIRDIDRVCGEIVKAEGNEGGRIDYLMMGQGGSIFLPRKDTKEGLDQTMSLMYYSRMRIILNLLPLLLASSLPATIISVYAAGMEAKLFPEDLSLRDLSHYSYFQARSHMVYFHTLFFERLAEQNPGKLRLIHIFPGLVLGPGFKNPELPRWFRILAYWFIFPLFGRFISVPPGECGERMVSLASAKYPPKSSGKQQIGNGSDEVVVGTDGKSGSGAYSLTWNGESNYKMEAYEKIDKEEMSKKVWEHTVRAFEVIEKGDVFTE